jgi:hypothetical protein
MKKWRAFSLAGRALGVAALFLLAPGLALAGPSVRAGSTTTQVSSARSSQTVSYRGAWAPTTVSLAVAQPSPRPAKGPLAVTLRGPDGQARRFPVEGGRSAIYYTDVVIRPGQSVTIRLVAR